MPLPREITDPRMLLSLRGFNATCTIQVNTPTTDTAGAPVPDWADFAGHIGLACNFYQPLGKRGGTEHRQDDGTFLDAFWICTLQQAWPDITTAMQLVFAGVSY